MGSGPAPALLAGPAADAGVGVGASAPSPLTLQPKPLTLQLHLDEEEETEAYPQVPLAQEVLGSPQFTDWKATWAAQLNIPPADVVALLTGNLTAKQDANDLAHTAPTLRGDMRDDLS